MRGETLFQRYSGADESKQPLDNDGWFHTGDTGSLDDDGYLSVSGRKDNMFVSGGENIHPEEIEASLMGLPEVLEVLVAPLDDEEFGSRPVAFVRFAPRGAPEREGILTRLKRKLPGFKLPVRFLQWPDPDDSGEMKPDRHRFRKLIEDDDVTEIS